MTVYSLQEAQEILFSFRFYVTYGGEEYEFTSDVSSMSVWHGEIAERVYGWSLLLTGKNYYSIPYASGNSVRVARGEISYDGSIMAVDDNWYNGKILTVPSTHAWQDDNWEMKVVDQLTYLSSRVSPVISTSEATVTSRASASADSYTVASNILGQGEVIGSPLLTPDMAVDRSMSSLWVSSKSPVIEPADSWYSHFWNAHLSEIFAWPIPALEKQYNTWLELCLLNPSTGAQPSNQDVRLMTRSGIIEFHGGPVEFGELYGPTVSDARTRFAAICFDSATMSNAWGTSPNHCPVHEWKNLSAAWTKPYDYGRVAGRNWGFNLDGNGDFLAVSWGVHPNDVGASGMPWGRNDPKWVTMFVEDGPSVSSDRIDNGATFGAYVSGTVVELHVSSQVAANHFAGCFFRAYPINPWDPGTHWFNSVRYIISHTASGATPPYVIRVTTDPHAWDSYNFPPATQTPITPWPAASWTEDWADSTGLTGSTNSSYKLKNYGKFNAMSRWELDRFPSVGYSGSFQNHETLAWILLEIEDMTLFTTSPVTFGDTVIQVASSDGFTQTGFIYIDLEGPFEYSSKTDTTITLVASYNGAGAASGATITQAEESGESILQWPVDHIALKRKAVSTGVAQQLRVIKNVKVYGTNVPSPDTPGGNNANWYEQWTQIAQNTNNLSSTVIEWNTVVNRYKYYLFVIHAMNDESQARINEITLSMPNSVVSATLENVTVASFFEYVLVTLLGFGVSEIDTSGCPSLYLGEFATDTVQYLALLSDMCRRTGTVIAVSRLGLITATKDLGWVNQPDIDPETDLTPGNTVFLSINRIDDRSISQVQITAQDYQGNISLGKYPPSPRFFGEPYREPDLFGIGDTDPNQIARYIFVRRTSPVVSCTTSGPALWVSPGLQAVTITYPGVGGEDQSPDLVGNWLVSSAEHVISFGSKSVPATWSTNLSLLKVS